MAGERVSLQKELEEAEKEERMMGSEIARRGKAIHAMEEVLFAAEVNDWTGHWECKSCTWSCNSSEAKVCEICGKERPQVASPRLPTASGSGSSAAHALKKTAASEEVSPEKLTTQAKELC